MPFLPNRSLLINMTSEFSVNCTLFPLLRTFRAHVGTLKGGICKQCESIPGHRTGKYSAQSTQLLIDEPRKEISDFRVNNFEVKENSKSTTDFFITFKA